MNIKDLMVACNKTSREHGFWEDAHKVRVVLRHEDQKVKEAFENMLVAQKLALIHSEVSEGLEAVRHGNPPDQHVPQHNGGVVEMADACIRIFDLCQEMGWDLENAIAAKMHFNASRPYKHGKIS